MYDVAVLGSGAAGIAFVKRALRNRLKVVLIEKDESSFGGTCLNKGCIPTKYFLRSSHGSPDWQDLVSKKNQLIQTIKNPLREYFLRAGLPIIWGQAVLRDANTLRVDDQMITAKHIVIATGSSPLKIIKHKNVITADEFLDSTQLPRRVLIIGGGYVGIEFASLLRNFDCDVTIVEKQERILSFLDGALVQRLVAILSKKGIKIIVSTDALGYNLDGYDLVIQTVGRHANTDGLNLESFSLLDEKGWIITDEHMRTPIKHIYACGDVNGRKLLAYVAECQASVSFENISGNEAVFDYSGIAECVFSIPQIAKVGMLADEARSKNIPIKILQSNFLRFSSAYVFDDTQGFMQVIVDEADRIIGAAIISHAASELISIFSLAVRYGMTLAQIRSCYFIHPSLSEIIPALLRES